MKERDERRAQAEKGWAGHKKIWTESGGTQGTEVQGMKVLQLTTVGRKSGEERCVLLTCLEVNDGWMVAGSNIGADHHPSWFLNLEANAGNGSVMADGQTSAIKARTLTGGERQKAWVQFKGVNASYAEYEGWTSREIPVVLLAKG